MLRSMFHRSARVSGRLLAIWKHGSGINWRTTRAITRAKLPLSCLALAGFSLHATSADARKKQEMLQKADLLFDEAKYTDLLRVLVEQESWYNDPDILWRVARCKYTMSKSEQDVKKANESLRDSLVNVERALELDRENGAAHKWAAILIDAVASATGTRERIEKTLVVRHHMEEAIRLMPKDATSHYLLGEWHYSLATTGWATRRLAAIMFATLPEASLHQALACFQQAEQVDPGFYSKNLLLTAKTLMALDRDREHALQLLQQVVQRFAASEKWDDKEAVTEARSILYKMGVRT